MRTTEERMYLIEKRRREIKDTRKRQYKEILTAAACLVILVVMGTAMPGIVGGMEMIQVNHASGVASIFGNHEALGYILMGILSFLLGMCVTMLLYRLRRKQERDRRKE